LVLLNLISFPIQCTPIPILKWIVGSPDIGHAQLGEDIEMEDFILEPMAAVYLPAEQANHIPSIFDA